MYLVDTNIISIGAPTKAVPMTELIKWMDEHSNKLYVSVVTVAEIEDGIAKAGLKRYCISTVIKSWLSMLRQRV